MKIKWLFVLFSNKKKIIKTISLEKYVSIFHSPKARLYSCKSYQINIKYKPGYTIFNVFVRYLFAALNVCQFYTT